MAFELPALGYAVDALEPHVDAQTMTIHHDKHHGAYVTNVNAAIAGNAALEKLSAEELIAKLAHVPEDKRTAVRNNGGGHVNHTMFWEIMRPGGPKAPVGDLAKAIDTTFGSFDKLKETINDAGMKRFGSGWSWLWLDRDGRLTISSTPNQDNPLMDGHAPPILGVDVWEHAYYLKYQNRRADYLKAWWNVVNWEEVGKRYARAKSWR
jgi:Fe-Mn family superoxide dismutase